MWVPSQNNPSIGSALDFLSLFRILFAKTMQLSTFLLGIVHTIAIQRIKATGCTVIIIGSHHRNYQKYQKYQKYIVFLKKKCISTETLIS